MFGNFIYRTITSRTIACFFAAALIVPAAPAQTSSATLLVLSKSEHTVAIGADGPVVLSRVEAD